MRRIGPGRACRAFSRARPAGWRRRCGVRRPSPACRRTPASRSIRAPTTCRSTRRICTTTATLAAGYPIATGVIEGACRYLVRDRMDLTGARWRLVGAEAVLKLRALRASGDFDPYWEFHEAREYERNHAQRYAARTAPPVSEPPPPPLSTTPSTRQVALAMPLPEAPWAVDEEEPHPNRGRVAARAWCVGPNQVRVRQRPARNRGSNR